MKIKYFDTFKSTFQKIERIDKLPIEEEHRNILNIIFNEIMKLNITELNKGISLLNIRKKWARLDATHIEIQSLFKAIELLYRERLISWSGPSNWEPQEQVILTLTQDGFFAGYYKLNNEEANKILDIANILFSILETLCIERECPEISEKEIIDSYRELYKGTPDQIIDSAIRLLVLYKYIRIENLGEIRGIWWEKLKSSSFQSRLAITSEKKNEAEKIKKLISELEKQIDTHESNYYEFSVFISHSWANYEELHALLLFLINNKIKPVVWFTETEENVRDKLCNKIDGADLFIIYLSDNTISSQMTNCEIGFVEGKRFYNKVNDNEQDIVLRLYKKGFNISNLKGFYTIGNDMIEFDQGVPDDLSKVVKRLKIKFNTLSLQLKSTSAQNISRPTTMEPERKINVEIAHVVTQIPELEHAIAVNASNPGYIPVTLEEVGIRLPNDYKIVIIRKFPSVQMPYELPEGKKCTAFIEIHELISELRKSKYSGIIELKGYYRSALGMVYYSKPMKFDIDEWEKHG